MGYLIKKNDKTQEIVYLDYDINGYIFKPNNKSTSSLTVNKVVVVNPSMIDKILTIKFNSLFKRIAYQVYRIVYDSDASEGDAMLVLDEVKRLKNIITHKYQQFLSDEKEREFLKKTKLLETEIKNKIVTLRCYQVPDEEKTVGKSR